MIYNVFVPYHLRLVWSASGKGGLATGGESESCAPKAYHWICGLSVKKNGHLCACSGGSIFCLTLGEGLTVWLFRVSVAGCPGIGPSTGNMARAIGQLLCLKSRKLQSEITWTSRTSIACKGFCSISATLGMEVPKKSVWNRTWKIARCVCWRTRGDLLSSELQLHSLFSSILFFPYSTERLVCTCLHSGPISAESESIYAPSDPSYAPSEPTN